MHLHCRWCRLLIGSAMIMPGDLTRADALKTRGMEAVRLMIGVAILLVFAGTIEGFISPVPMDRENQIQHRRNHGRGPVFLPAVRWPRQRTTQPQIEATVGRASVAALG